MYDHDINKPTLFSDTWEFDPKFKTWKQIYSYFARGRKLEHGVVQIDDL